MAAIIFDFDGTIADSFDYIAGFLAEDAGLSLTERQMKDLRGQSMVSVARKLGHPWWRLLSLFFSGRRRMGAVMERVEPFAGMREVIEKLHAEGHELFILSSNTVANIHAFLHHHGLHVYFLEVDGGVGLLGKGRALRRLLRSQGLEKDDAVYVGDEPRDVRGAHKAGLRVVAVTWGFASPAELKALKPTHIADTPEDLMKILEEL